MICKNELRCTMKDRYCGECKHNPNAELQDHFMDRGYIPVCEYGYDDCIHDPARKLYEYHNCSWTRKTYSLKELENKMKKGATVIMGIAMMTRINSRYRKIYFRYGSFE